MGGASVRSSSTGKGGLALSPWNDGRYIYSITQIILGNNPLSKIEIVSALNSFNLAFDIYHFNDENCFQKYNPKVYIGAVQTASTQWNYDYQIGQKNGLPNMKPDGQKSGSWPFLCLPIYIMIYVSLIIVNLK